VKGTMKEETKELTAVAIREQAQGVAVVESPKDSNAQRNEAVGAMLAKSYENASNLRLTDDEIAKLRAPFADSQVRGGAKGKETLLYISHIHLSDRLNEVIGIGQWVMIRRSERVDTNAGMVYVDCAMLIRGTLVAEAIGAGKYRANNAMTDFSDAIESAMSDALQRLCKRLSIGSQVWDAAFCEAWLKRNMKPRAAVTVPAASIPKPTTTEGT